MIAACSHLVLTSPDVGRMVAFLRAFFELEPHYSNDQFADFVLPGGFRIAFFAPVGAVTRYFSNAGERHFGSIGVTTTSLDALYERSLEEAFKGLGVQTSGPPKEHPWGERSFLLLDPDGNRWEITQSPSKDGMLVNRG